MKTKKILKLTIRAISELCFIVYPYIIFLKLINASDEITLLGIVLMIVYVPLAINICEWAWSDK